MNTEKNIYSLKYLAWLLFGFFIYINFAPSLRLVLVGGQEAKTAYEFLITALPDIFFLLIILFSIAVYYKGARFRLTRFDWIIIFYLVFNIIYGSILSGNLFISAQGFRVTYLSMLFYFVARLFSSEGEQGTSGKLLLNVFWFYALFVIAGLILHFGFADFEKSLIKTNGNIQSAYFIARMGSFILMPVVFATIVSFACSYFYYRLLNNGAWWNYIFIAILWTGIFLSVSRGPIISFLIAFITLTILSRKWVKALGTLFLITVISGLLSWILIGSLSPLAWLFSSAFDTLSMGEHITRVGLWIKSLHDFQQRPFGYGLGHAGVTAVRFLKHTNIPAAVYTTDGWYLKLACETGIPGLLSYLILFGSFFYAGAKYIRNNGFTFFSFIFTLAVMINAQNIVENVLDFYPYIALYWFILGLSQQWIGQRQSV